MNVKHLLVASYTPPTGDGACNPGMSPDWESAGNLLGYRRPPNQLSHTIQGQEMIFFSFFARKAQKTILILIWAFERVKH